MTGFGRSNSLSINTSGSLFGNNTNTSQGQQSAGLFGSTNATSQPATAGGLFGSTSQPQSGGLFGGASAAASQPPQSGGLFGATQQASQPQSAGLFGNLNKPATAGTGASTGLFGSSTTASQPQAAGGLFGGALGGNAQNQNQTQNTQTGGLLGSKPSLFGSSTAQPAATSSLFVGGNANTQQNQTTTPSLFGATQQNQPQQQQQQSSLFGGMASQNKPLGGLGNSTTGLGNNQQAVQYRTLDNIKGTHRLHELHPDLQAEIQKLDDTFQYHISNSIKLREAMLKSEQEVATVAPDVVYVEEFLATIETGLVNDSTNIAKLKEVIKKDAEEALLSFRAIENHKLPAQFHYGNRTNLNASSAKPAANNSLDEDDPNKPVDLVSYFSRRTEDLGRTLDVYQHQIREIEAHLRTMEAGTVEKAQQLTGSRNGARDQRKELVEAMKAIEGAILDAAKKVGQTRDMVNQQTLGGVGGA
ncbi:hypothetical protein BU24DRAFT_473149 [Aaosphaeria arxii CBS 175.79]|uniref:Nucleoporin Nup54 alpha-helical domain-containing protein n=1 Tax=Aaosphaeria arxii CBS 175.79 TaxID=1450172 RepID=A0A6A5XAM3_9PLEO|nr:uncharacterized protein BU24DRAFT_473149 [Aaosphaeria arxii CBS 175.79]KAF2009991.1 hypothetical protein BU24DRAFT_473149 [Aaosphaeria arxii CBS 175.79]